MEKNKEQEFILKRLKNWNKIEWEEDYNRIKEEKNGKGADILSDLRNVIIQSVENYKRNNEINIDNIILSSEDKENLKNDIMFELQNNYPDIDIKYSNNVLNLSINPGNSQKSGQKYNKFNSRDKEVIQFCSFDIKNLEVEKGIEEIIKKYKINEEYIFRRYYNRNFDIFENINGKYYWVGLNKEEIKDSFKKMLPYFIIHIKNPKEAEKIRSRFRENNIPIELIIDDKKGKILKLDEIEKILNETKIKEEQIKRINTYLDKEKFKFNAFNDDQINYDIDNILMNMYYEQHKELEEKKSPLVFFNDLFWIADSNQNDLVTILEQCDTEKMNEYVRKMLNLYIKNYKLKLIVVTNGKATQFIKNAIGDKNEEGTMYEYRYIEENNEIKTIPIIFSGFLKSMDKFSKVRLMREIKENYKI